MFKELVTLVKPEVQLLKSPTFAKCTRCFGVISRWYSSMQFVDVRHCSRCIFIGPRSCFCSSQIELIGFFSCLLTFVVSLAFLKNIRSTAPGQMSVQNLLMIVLSIPHSKYVLQTRATLPTSTSLCHRVSALPSPA
ncbi:hypothetical protein K439DRAFT_494062 [Ramaria rubella]|nr:hypothetical protein K439DRAFT_494062 [Ramaria rubella]